MSKSIPFSPSRLDGSIFLKKNLKYLVKNRNSIIDIGCGQLYFYYILSALGIRGNYLGIDLNLLKLKKPSQSLLFKHKKIDFFHFKSNHKFDVAACLWVLEHLKNDRFALAKISNLLKNQGILILAVPTIWTWPLEFGRHGYHYYTKKQILNLVSSSGLKIVKFYEAGGTFGLLFMFAYNWLRFFILLISAPIFLILNKVGLITKNWKEFSSALITSTLYRYHRSNRAINIHNMIIGSVVSIDNNFKLLPQSYILFLKKNESS